jgi:E3 ubiquitin-protein ligase NRDP1
MGYDISRFTGEISEELMCSICSEILRDPLTTECEHLYCRECISDWLKDNRTCPIDRLYIHLRNLRPAPRVIRNLLGKLDIHCDYMSDGCQKIVPLETLDRHVNDCYYNPKKLLKCEMGCEKMMTREELKTHNCWKDIRIDLQTQQQRIVNLVVQRNIFVSIIFLLLIYLFFTSILYYFYFENLFILLNNN